MVCAFFYFLFFIYIFFFHVEDGFLVEFYLLVVFGFIYISCM
jgi:hypothetical protein